MHVHNHHYHMRTLASPTENPCTPSCHSQGIERTLSEQGTLLPTQSDSSLNTGLVRILLMVPDCVHEVSFCPARHCAAESQLCIAHTNTWLFQQQYYISLNGPATSVCSLLWVSICIVPNLLSGSYPHLFPVWNTQAP